MWSCEWKRRQWCTDTYAKLPYEDNIVKLLQKTSPSLEVSQSTKSKAVVSYDSNFDFSIICLYHIWLYTKIMYSSNYIFQAAFCPILELKQCSYWLWSGEIWHTLLTLHKQWIKTVVFNDILFVSPVQQKSQTFNQNLHNTGFKADTYCLWSGEIWHTFLTLHKQ